MDPVCQEPASRGESAVKLNNDQRTDSMELHDSDMLMEGPAAALVDGSAEVPSHDSIPNSIAPPKEQVEEDPRTIWNKQKQKLRRYIISARTFLASNKTSTEKEALLRRHIICITERLRKLHRKEARLTQRSRPPPKARHLLSSIVPLHQTVRGPDPRRWLIPIKRVCLERVIARLRLWSVRIQYENNLHHPEVFKAARNMDHTVHQFQKAHDQVSKRRDMRPKEPRFCVLVAVMSALYGITSLPESVASKFAKDVENKYCYRGESHHESKLSKRDETRSRRRCPVLNVEPCPMQAVSIFPLRAAQEGMLGVFGEKMFPELITAHNGLWLTTLIAEMFARFEVTIVPYDHPYQDSYSRIHFVNVPDQTLKQLTYSGRPGERFADLDGKKLEFSTAFRPRTEFLYFHHVCALIALWSRQDLQKEGEEDDLNRIKTGASEGWNDMNCSGSKNFDLSETEPYLSLGEEFDILWDKTRSSNRNLAYLRSLWRVEGSHLRRHLMQKLAIKYGAALPDGHRNHCKHVADEYVSEDEEMVLELLVEDAIRASSKEESPPLRELSILQEAGEEIQEIIYDSVDEVEDEDDSDNGDEDILEGKQNDVEMEVTNQNGVEIEDSDQDNVEMEETRETTHHDISSEIDESQHYSEDFEGSVKSDDENDLDYWD